MRLNKTTTYGLNHGNYGRAKMMTAPDPQKSKKVMEAMLKMKKIIIDDLKRAYEGK